jgi:tetratricopeptide (TPR) repeat protein
VNPVTPEAAGTPGGVIQMPQSDRRQPCRNRPASGADRIAARPFAFAAIAIAPRRRHFAPMPVRLALTLALTITLAAMLTLSGGAPYAAEPDPPAAADKTQDAQQRRAALFSELAAAKTEADARAVEARIWEFWLTAPDAQSQQLLEDSKQAQLGFDYRDALTALGKLIAHAPDYAEGHNQRAYVLFLMGAYGESLQAIEETLKREPKHYGALAGKGVILLMQGKDEEGQAALRQAHKVNPWLKERGLITDTPGRRI